MSNPMIALPLVPALGVLALLASYEATETYDLQPKVTAGQQLSVVEEASGTFQLTNADINVGSESLPEDPVVDVEFSLSSEADIGIIAAKDGEAESLQITITEDDGNVFGEAGLMGMTQTFDESMDSDLPGHTVLVEMDEGGNLSCSDVTDDESLERLSDSDLEDYDLNGQFWTLLPAEPVGVGDSWDVGAVLIQQLEEGMEEGFEEAAEEGDAADREDIETGLAFIQDSADMEFIGTLQSIDGSLAKIEWTLSMSLDELDILGLIRELGEEEALDEIPVDDFELSTSANIEFTGVGEFDMESHQLTSFQFEGSYSTSWDGSMSVEGSDVDLLIEFDGTLEFSGGVTVE